MKTSRFALVVACAAVFLTGCATTPATSPTTTPETSPTTEPASSATLVNWMNTTSIVVVPQTCGARTADVVPGVRELTVTLEVDPDATCTEGSAPVGQLVMLPPGFDSSADLTVTVEGDEGGPSTVILPGLADGEEILLDRAYDPQPGASWVTPSKLAILTWGSSSCPPTGAKIDAAAATITMEDPAPDRPCTMDFAPRIVVVDAPAEALNVQKFELVGSVNQDGDVATITPMPPLG